MGINGHVRLHVQLYKLHNVSWFVNQKCVKHEATKKNPKDMTLCSDSPDSIDSLLCCLNNI